MLRRLLESFLKLEKDSRSSIMLVVVENGEQAGAAEIVAAFSDRLDIHHVNEPQLGIVNARNTAIAYFLESGADWMASIDDDEIISPHWVSAMLDAIYRFSECRVFAGPQIRLTPENGSRWLPIKKPEDLITGKVNWNVSTANVLFKRDIFAANGMGMRFHPDFNFSGGEDTHFFHMLKDRGEPIFWVKEAECFEPTIEQRGTLKEKARRKITTSHNWGRINLMRFGAFTGGLLVFWYMIASVLNTFSFLVLGAVVLVFSEEKGVIVLSKSLQNALEAVGFFKALFGKSGTYYRNTDGN